MSTRVNLEVLNEGVRAVFDEASHRRRKFVETVELQIAFKKAYGKKTLAPVPFRLQHPTKHNFKVCVLGDEQRCLEARANKVDCLDLEGILQKKKKPSGVKHLVKKYDAFLVPTSMMKDVQDQIGFSLKKAHKVPLPLENEDSVVEKANEAKTTLRFNMKKALWVAVSVGNLTMSPSAVAENIDQAVGSLLSLLKDDWIKIKSMHIKASMGPAQRIY
ncbi:hypothetical protein V5799_019790 [Amblyomma americanum]|uniref:Large ribosomal subunit protein uL1 n=1 Tax=Amblyomma americanum TaxID=6943 RepID=A0AAQ4EW94_AMBAM